VGGVREDECNFLAGTHCEPALMAHLHAGEFDRRVENECVCPSDGDQAPLSSSHPRDVVPVLEAHYQLGPHSNFTFDAPYDPNDPRMTMPRGHEVDDLHDTSGVMISVSSTIVVPR
jgi:hypothetical protein